MQLLVKPMVAAKELDSSLQMLVSVTMLVLTMVDLLVQYLVSLMVMGFLLLLVSLMVRP